MYRQVQNGTFPDWSLLQQQMRVYTAQRAQRFLSAPDGVLFARLPSHASVEQVLLASPFRR